jgi:hypothetical protein
MRNRSVVVGTVLGSVLLVVVALVCAITDARAQGGLPVAPAGYYRDVLSSGEYSVTPQNVTGTLDCVGNECTGDSQVSGWDKSYQVVFDVDYGVPFEGMIIPSVTTLGTGGDFENEFRSYSSNSGNYFYYQDNSPGRYIGNVCYLTADLYNADSAYWDSYCDYYPTPNFQDISPTGSYYIGFALRHKIYGGGQSIPYYFNADNPVLIMEGEEPHPDFWGYGGTDVVTCTITYAGTVSNTEILTQTGDANLLLNPSFELGNPHWGSFGDSMGIGSHNPVDEVLGSAYFYIPQGVDGGVYQSIYLPPIQEGYDLHYGFHYLIEDGSLFSFVGGSSYLDVGQNAPDWGIVSGYHTTLGGGMNYQIEGSVPLESGGVAAFDLAFVYATISGSTQIVCVDDGLRDDYLANDDDELPTVPPLPTMGQLPTIGAIAPTIQPFIDVTPAPTSCYGVWGDVDVLSYTIPSLTMCIEPNRIGLESNPANIVTDNNLVSVVNLVFLAVVATAIVGWVRFR